MTLPKLVFAAMSIVLASTAASNAGVMYEQQSFGPATTNWGTSSNTVSFNPLQSLNFAGFSTGLGTLTSVVLSFTETSTGSVTMTNNGSASSNVDAYLINNAKLSAPVIGTKLVLDVSSDYSTFLLSGASSGSQIVSGAVTSPDFTVTGASNMANYAVAWSALVGDLGGVQVSADNGNGSAIYTDNSSILVNVAYYYSDPVPEPATLIMLGTGLLGISSMVRRKRSGNTKQH